MARSPLWAGVTPVTVPETELPAGITLWPSSIDALRVEPFHALPTLAVSEVRAVASVTSIAVPEGKVRSAARGVDVLLVAFWAVCSLRHPESKVAATSATAETRRV